MHPSNLHQESYDMSSLIKSHKELAPFIITSVNQQKTIDFSDANAVIALNTALLEHHYGIKKWSFPPGYLCPPIPGRADYLHYLADFMLASGLTKSIKGLDIGTGANYIYPLLGAQINGWNMVGAEIDPTAFESAQQNLAENPQLKPLLSLRFQDNPSNIFSGIIKTGEVFDFTMCNPPFHASAEAAFQASQRKLNNLGISKHSPLNFGGMSNELWCNGGEALFIKRMIKESVNFAKQVKFFTTLVSRKEHVPPLEKLLQKRGATFQLIAMTHGHKKSRILVWNFPD